MPDNVIKVVIEYNPQKDEVLITGLDQVNYGLAKYLEKIFAAVKVKKAAVKVKKGELSESSQPNTHVVDESGKQERGENG